MTALDQFHPEVIARHREHARSCTHGRDEDCHTVPDPDDLAAVWAGRARMARARREAGVPLDAVDEEALRRTVEEG